MVIRGDFDTEPGWPTDVFSSRTRGMRRLLTEPGITAQMEGRAFRLSREFAIDATPLVLRVTSPIDFKIIFQQLTVDVGGIVMHAYRDSSVTEGGTYSTTEDTFGSNDASFVPSYTPQIVIESGGSITPTGPAAETIRVRTSGATAQQTTITGSTGDERLLGAGTYYLEFARMSGVTATTRGVYTLNYEEFPQSAQ